MLIFSHTCLRWSVCYTPRFLYAYVNGLFIHSADLDEMDGTVEEAVSTTDSTREKMFKEKVTSEEQESRINTAKERKATATSKSDSEVDRYSYREL